MKATDPEVVAARRAATFAMDEEDPWVLLRLDSGGHVVFVREPDGSALWLGHHATLSSAIEALAAVGMTAEPE